MDWADASKRANLLANPSALWAQDGFSTIEAATEEYEAALMCTSHGDLLEDDLRLPARHIKFRMRTDLGIGAPPIVSLACAASASGQTGWSLTIAGHDVAFMKVKKSIGELLMSGGHEEALNPADYSTEVHLVSLASTLEEKVVDLVCKYVTGMLFSYQNKANWTHTGLALSRHKRLRGDDPKHRVAFIGRPVRVDMRPHIQSYIHGTKRSAPSLQVMVRGHYKRQVVGVLGSGRKVIWVQPYWRGPEDAPILVRPVQL